MPEPIVGVPTSTAGFLGVSRRGPEEARLVTSFPEFQRLYGGHMDPAVSTLAFAVEGFFQNGGRRAFIGRIAAGDATVLRYSHGKSFSIEGIGPGAWADNIAAKIEAGSSSSAARPLFKLTVAYWEMQPPLLARPRRRPPQPVDPTDPAQKANPNRREPTLLEVFDDLSADRASPDFYESRINANSVLIRIKRSGRGKVALLGFAMLGTEATGVSGIDGGPVAVEDYQGRSPGTGLLGFENVDEIAILVAPDHARFAGGKLTAGLIAHCTRMRDRFAVLNSNAAVDTTANINGIQPPQDTAFAAFYFPWIRVLDPRTHLEVLIPPSGHVAGVYARTDVEQGVFKAPANEVLRGARSLQFDLTAAQQTLLNPRGVNAIRAFPERGIRVWGARTCSSNAEWKYVNVRRYFLFLAESIVKGTRWAVFEHNDESLWAQVRQSITHFLVEQWRAGALMGNKPEQAFFVQVDRRTMTQDDIDNGRLIVVVGIATVRPAEFISLRFMHSSDGSEVTDP